MVSVAAWPQSGQVMVDCRITGVNAFSIDLLNPPEKTTREGAGMSWIFAFGLFTFLYWRTRRAGSGSLNIRQRALKWRYPL
jgi:hypothetical protein